SGSVRSLADRETRTASPERELPLAFDDHSIGADGDGWSVGFACTDSDRREIGLNRRLDRFPVSIREFENRPGVAGRKTYPIYEIDRRQRALARTESRPDRTIIAEDRTVVARHDHRRIGGGNIGERRVRVLDTDLLVALAAVRDFVDRLVGIHEVAAVVVGELNCRDARPTTRF